MVLVRVILQSDAFHEILGGDESTEQSRLARIPEIESVTPQFLHRLDHFADARRRILEKGMHHHDVVEITRSSSFFARHRAQDEDVDRERGVDALPEKALRLYDDSTRERSCVAKSDDTLCNL